MNLRHVRAARLPSDDRESGVALLSVILYMLLLTGISVVILSSILGEVLPSFAAQKSTRTVYAAQAGLQAGLGLLRSDLGSPDAHGHIYGDPTKLPCALNGNLDGAEDGYRYSVQFQYFITDPTGTTAAWQAQNSLKSCPKAGLGVSPQPVYAILIASGQGPVIPGSSSDSYEDRAISAIYKFNTTNVNIPGGRIYDLGGAYCLDALAAAPGQTIRFLPAAQCKNDALELWVYDTDYKLKLASTLANNSAGLCITGPVNFGDPTQNALLQPCLANTDPGVWNQLWSWTGAYTWQGQKRPISDGTNNNYLSPGAANGASLVGHNLLVATKANGQFAPSSAVGAGAAGFSTHQLVNYQEFGRCADVTNEDIASSYMISYPCKQDPTGTGKYLLWNHKWFYSEPPVGTPSLANQQIFIYLQDNSAKKYCLQSAANAGGYPVFVLCNGSTLQNWTRVYDSGNYVTSYLFIDSNGRCLAANPGDTYQAWSKLIVTTCTGSDAQKWNVPAKTSGSKLGGFREFG
ncbi:MAG: hypothetical protein ABI067_01280 [Leifsonia sp.]